MRVHCRSGVSLFFFNAYLNACNVCCVDYKRARQPHCICMSTRQGGSKKKKPLPEHQKEAMEICLSYPYNKPREKYVLLKNRAFLSNLGHQMVANIILCCHINLPFFIGQKPLNMLKRKILIILEGLRRFT